MANHTVSPCRIPGTVYPAVFRLGDLQDVFRRLPEDVRVGWIGQDPADKCAKSADFV